MKCHYSDYPSGNYGWGKQDLSQNLAFHFNSETPEVKKKMLHSQQKTEHHCESFTFFPASLWSSMLRAVWTVVMMRVKRLPPELSGEPYPT